jgi:sec-independent protein translocase protein TatB
MFDIGWSELLVIAIVAIVVVGPKELPRVLRSFGHYAGKLKRTAAEFRRQFDEAMLESELDDARKSFERAAKEAEAKLKLPDGPPVMLPKAPAPQPAASDPAPAPKRAAKPKDPAAKRAPPAKQAKQAKAKAKAEPAP